MDAPSDPGLYWGHDLDYDDPEMEGMDEPLTDPDDGDETYHLASTGRTRWEQARWLIPGLQPLIERELITLDFDRILPAALASVALQTCFRDAWLHENYRTRGSSYLVLVPHPDLIHGTEEALDIMINAGYALMAYRFWIRGFVTYTGRTTYRLITAPPEPVRVQNFSKVVNRYARGSRKVVEGEILRIPPVREVVVFETTSLAMGTVERGGLCRFRKARLEVARSRGDLVVHVHAWSEYSGVAPAPSPPQVLRGGIKTEGERPRAPVTYRQMAPQELVPRAPEIALEAGPHDPNASIARAIQGFSRDFIFSAVARVMGEWNEALGGFPGRMNKMPPLGLLRAVMHLMSQNRLSAVADRLGHYRTLLYSSQTFKSMVARDMILFDESGDLGTMLGSENVRRDLISLWHNLPVAGGRFLVFMTRNDDNPSGSGDVDDDDANRELYRLIIDMSVLGTPYDSRLVDAAPLSVEQAPLLVANLTSSSLRPSHRVDYLLGFGNPRVGPLFSTQRQIYRLARLYTQEEQDRTREPMGPWTYYEGGTVGGGSEPSTAMELY